MSNALPYCKANGKNNNSNILTRFLRWFAVIRKQMHSQPSLSLPVWRDLWPTLSFPDVLCTQNTRLSALGSLTSFPLSSESCWAPSALLAEITHTRTQHPLSKKCSAAKTWSHAKNMQSKQHRAVTYNSAILISRYNVNLQRSVMYSTCIQLSAALVEGLHLCTELWDLTVHGLQVCILHIFKLSLWERLAAISFSWNMQDDQK